VREQLVGVVGPIVPILETREEWVALVVGFVVGLVIVFGFWCCWRSTSQRRRPSSDRRFRADLGMPEQQSSASFEMGAAARPVRSDINLSQQQQQFVSNSSQFVPQPASDQPQPRPWEVEQGSWNDDQPPPPPPR
jgi:ABC-type nickel/cobalt efflux system permease component RcnA